MSNDLNTQILPAVDIREYDVIRVKAEGKSFMGVVLNNMHRPGQNATSSLVIYPIKPVRNPSEQTRQDALNERDESYYVSGSGYKTQLGLTPENDYKVVYEVTDLQVDPDSKIKKIGTLPANARNTILKKYDSQKVKLDRGFGLLDDETYRLLQGPKISYHTIDGPNEYDEPQLAFNEPQKATLPVIEPNHIREIEKSVSEKSAPPELVIRETSAQSENPTLFQLNRRGQLSDYSRMILSGHSKAETSKPIINKKTFKPVIDDGKPLVIETMTQAFERLNDEGFKKRAVKEFDGFTLKRIEIMRCELNSALEIYPQPEI